MRRAMRRPMGVNRTVESADVRRSGGGVQTRRRLWARVNISLFPLLVHDVNAVCNSEARMFALKTHLGHRITRMSRNSTLRMWTHC